MKHIYKVEHQDMGIILIHFEAELAGEFLDCTIKGADMNGKLRISTGTIEARKGVNKDIVVPLSPKQYRQLLNEVLEDAKHYRKNF